ncbi:MAG: sulfatase family protein, partial [Terriglobales bacterium]
SSTSTARGKLNRSLKRAAHAIGLGSLYDELYFQYCLRSASRAAGNVDSLRRFPTAERIVDRALSWLQGVDTRPFFLWLHLMDPHSPYYPTAASYRELTGKEISAKRARYLNEYWNRSDLTPARLERKKASIVELYDAGIRGVDSQIARLVSHLQQSGRWDECTFAFTADHGEEFLDHGRRYHAPVSLHEEVVRVPLMIRVPGVTGRESAKKEIAKKGPPPAPFSHVHLAPTLLDLLGVPSPAGFQGTSLWRNLQAGTPWEIPAVTECVHGCTNPLPRQDRMGARLLSVRSGPYKLTLPMESDLLESNSIQWSAIEKLYNLGEDPKEERPLPAGAHREIRGRLLRAARTQLRASSNGARASLRLKARLRDLRVELQSKSR